jgi:adenylate cyclase
MGVGIEYGEVIVGETGHPQRMHFTAMGDPVNMASRIESMTKEKKVRLLVSSTVFEHIKDVVRVGRVVRTPIKGKTGTHCLHEIRGLTPSFWKKERLRNREELLWQEMHGCFSQNEGPALRRLAFHDAINGMNGAIRLEPKQARGLDAPMAILQKAMKHLNKTVGEISWADLIAVAGAVAIEKCGGPEIRVPLGREDATTPPPPGRVPPGDMEIGALKRRFVEMGYSVRELVALSGAHTIGKSQGKPFTYDLFTFNNSYFQRLLDPGTCDRVTLLATDAALASDPECRPIVEQYAADQAAFFRDFAEAYRKMTILGSSLDPDRAPRYNPA